MFLDFDAIYSEARGQAFRSGKKRYYDNRVYDLFYNADGGRPTVTAKVRAQTGEGRSVRIEFDGTGGLYDYGCDCGDCETAVAGPCRHIVAAALAYEEKFPSQPPMTGNVKTAKTDAVIYNLSSEYAKRRKGRNVSDRGEIGLSPILGMHPDGKLYLRFLLGKTRKYLLKDISDFSAAYQSKSSRRYGVDLDFVVASESFEQESRPLAEFLVASYREKISSGIGIAARDELPISGGDTDEFFSLLDGHLTAFETAAAKNGMRLIEKGENNLSARIKIESGDGGYYLSTDLFERSQLILGKKYHYILTDARISRITPDYSAAVWPLLRALGTHGRLFILCADMPLFYNNVLTALSGRLEIDAGKTDLTQFEAAPFSAKLTLGLACNGGMEGGLDAFYDDEKLDLFDDGFTVSAVRDYETERMLLALLTEYFPRCPDLTLLTEEEIYRFLKEGAFAIGEYADIYFSDEVQGYRIKRPPRFRVGIRIESGLLEVETEADGYSPAELKEILSGSKERRTFIRLSDGSFVDLSDPGIAALGDFFASSGRSWEKTMQLPAYYAPFLDNELKHGMFYFERDAGFKSLCKSLSTASDASFAVPSALKDILRNYQKTGFRWLKTLTENGFGGILADDMGLGKSLQVIALLLSGREQRKEHSLIVCPTSLILNWMGEFEKFAPDMNILAVMGTQAEREAALNRAVGNEVLITSYELLRRDIELYRGLALEFAILDEAQYIKNPETRNAKSVKTLNAKHRFALTGTPIENSLSELWSIFDFIMPGYLLSYAKFRDRFESEIVRGGKAAVEKFRKLVAPFILRRLKTEVLTELPPKIETDVVAVMEGQQKKLYAANLQLIRDAALSAGEKVNKVVVLGMLTKLRQICCDPSLVYPDYTGNSAKFDSAIELCESAISGGHKILLFTQFTSMIELFRKRFAADGITHYVLKGDTAKSERMRLVNKFNRDDTNVFLISLKAGGTGLNLTGADVVIHYDPWWNESVTNQATDRAYRIGQDKPVQVYKTVLENSVEKRILELQKKKSALSDLVIGGTAESVKYEDLLKILAE